MKQIDFSQTGGLPLTQDILNYMQGAQSDVLVVLAQALGGGNPVILTGCAYGLFAGTGVNRLRAGWIYYNGTIYRTAGGEVPLPPYAGTQTPGFTVSTASTNLTYNDGNMHGSLQEQILLFGMNADSVSDATHFPISVLQPFVKDAAAHVATITGISTGTISYRKNWLNNTLQIWGTLTLTNAQTVGPTGFGTGPEYYGNVVLPAGYIPATLAPFTLYYRYHDDPILDDTGKDYITQVNGEVDTNGSINIGWRRAAAGVASYTVYFNTIIPLD